MNSNRQPKNILRKKNTYFLYILSNVGVFKENPDDGLTDFLTIFLIKENHIIDVRKY